MGIVQRNGQVKAFPIPARNADQVVSLVCAHTSQGSLYYTDDWQAYASLRVQGDHIVVRKDKGRPRGAGPYQRHRGLLEPCQRRSVIVIGRARRSSSLAGMYSW